MRRHPTAPTKRQATGLGRILAGAFAGRDASVAADGTGAPATGRFALLLASVAALVALVAPAAASADPLPDGRAYEQVSPVDKEGSDIETSTTMAAVDGNRFYFLSKGSFAGQKTTLASEATPYLATRGPSGWGTEGIALLSGKLSFKSEEYQGWTSDLSKGILQWQDNTCVGPYDPEAKLNYNQYLRDSATGIFQLINGHNSAMVNDDGFRWGSTDFSNLALTSSLALAPGGACTKTIEEGSWGPYCAWESENGVVRPASILPDGTPVRASVGTEIPGDKRCNFEHAMSDDGSRLFFTTIPSETESQKVYARNNGTTTTLVSGSERTLPGGAAGFPTYFQSAEAAHGDRVFFTTANSLVDADNDATKDMYMYDFTQPAGERLTLISADQNPAAPEGADINGGFGRCGGIVGASEDAHRVYFVANNQIVAGAPEDEGPKLYLWDDSDGSPEVNYIGTLNASTEEDFSLAFGDGRIWASPAVDVRNSGYPRQARWSRDGRYLAFISSASLTGFDNEGEEEIFRYDAVSHSLVCITCTADAFPAHGSVSWQEHSEFTKPVNHMPRNVSDSGQVFFQTTRGLTLHDSNGQQDVYEYDVDGQLRLISKGTGAYPSAFFDATPSGSDVFFRTRDQLVGWDIDGNFDAYDARVGGGLPEPAFVPPVCEGEACLSPPVVPNDPTPSSSTFQGAGNVKPHRCKRGYVRRHGKCRKKRGRKHRGHHQHTTRSHG